MVMYHRKKVRKYRGSKSHGGGSKKKRRGAGNRGGRGMAGSGKRADQKKRQLPPNYFGKQGFARKKTATTVMNVGDVALRAGDRITDGKIDLQKIGVDKLLGGGKITRGYVVHGKVSKRAKEKIEKLGGSVHGHR